MMQSYKAFAKDDKAILHYVDGSKQGAHNIVHVVVIKPGNRSTVVKLVGNAYFIHRFVKSSAIKSAVNDIGPGTAIAGTFIKVATSALSKSDSDDNVRDAFRCTVLSVQEAKELLAEIAKQAKHANHATANHATAKPIATVRKMQCTPAFAERELKDLAYSDIPNKSLEQVARRWLAKPNGIKQWCFARQAVFAKYGERNDKQ